MKVEAESLAGSLSAQLGFNLCVSLTPLQHSRGFIFLNINETEN